MIKRKVDKLGRIVIPREMRKELGILESDYLKIYVENNCIVLKRTEPACKICGEKHIWLNKELQICKLCIEKVKCIRL